VTKLLLAIGIVTGGALLGFVFSALMGRDRKPTCSSGECAPCDPMDVHAHQARVHDQHESVRDR
jgi:hypothetical protein